MGTRRSLVISLLSLAAVLVGVLFANEEAVARRALTRALVVATDDVARLAGFRNDSEQGALPVEVIVDGQEPWLSDAAGRVVDLDPAFSVRGGPHRLRFEYLHDRRTWVVRGQLERKGWSLRPPRAVVARIVPWVAVLAAALGGALWGRGVPVAVAAVAAGLGAQLGLQAIAWPSGQIRPRWWDAVGDGPLGRMVLDWAQSLPEVSFALGAGIVALCGVLVGFDHRRSRGRGGWALLTAVAMLLSALAWIEAAMRAEIWAWIGTFSGAVGALGLLGLWAGPAWALRARCDAGPRGSGEAEPGDAAEPGTAELAVVGERTGATGASDTGRDTP